MTKLPNIRSCVGRSLVVLILVLVAFPNDADGQTIPLDPTKRLSQYIQDDWNIDDGLPQNSVRALAQTKDGYIWIGTDDGLARFDGQTFQIFDKSNVQGFEGGHAIRALYADELGTLWIGTTGSGLIRLDDGQFSTADDLTAAAISHISKDASGRMWVGSWDAGLFLIDDAQVSQFSTETGLLSNFVTSVRADTESRIWIGTREGLHYLDVDSIKAFPNNLDLSSQFITALELDASGNLLVGTLEGLHVVANDNVLMPPDGLASSTGIRTIWKDDTDVVWIGTDQMGLLRYANGIVSAADATSGVVSSNRILAFLQDTEKSLWIGTEMGGLNRFRNGIFTPYSEIEGFANEMSYAVAGDAAGNVWVGSDGGLNRINFDGSVTTFSQKDGLTSDVVMSLEPSGTGGIWIGTMGGGLNKFENGSFRQYIKIEDLPSPRIFAIAESDNGDLWIGTDAGVALFSRGVVTTFTTEDGLASDFLTTIHVASDGAVWLGTYDGGISVFDNGSFINIDIEDGLVDNLILDVTEDSKGNMWIGTANGLSLNRNGQFESFSTENGLPSDVIMSIVEDDIGDLWFSSTDGIFRIRSSQFDEATSDNSSDIRYELFDRSHGLRSTEMNGGFQPAAWKDSSGAIWFPSGIGVASVDPQKIFRNQEPPPVVLQGIVIDGKQIAPAKELSFRPGTKRLDIKYAGLSFIVPEKMQYRYILDGYETEWQLAGNARIATYTNLDPGNYTFRVIASNGDGVWNETGAQLSFYLRPFFYQTRWFLALCLISLGFFAFTGYKLRIRQLKRREAELEATVDKRTRELRLEKETTERQAAELEKLSQFKTRFFANVSHEFRTPLTMIVGPLENAISGMHGEISDGLRRQLEIMLRNALRLMRLINQLLDLQKIEAGKMQLQVVKSTMAPFVEGILFSCSALADQKSIQLEFDDYSIDDNVYFEPDKLEKVFYNLISNALKFTPAGGTIRAEIHEVAPSDSLPLGALAVKVSDTGQGIEPAGLSEIFDRFTQSKGMQPKDHEGTGIGLALVKDLTVLHGGSIDVESVVGEGTTFTVLLPKGRDHLSDDDVQSAERHVESAENAIPNVAMIGADVESTTDVAAPTTISQAASKNDPLVLIIDDNVDICQYMAQILSPQFRVVIAHDGVDGLSKVHEHRPDLVISDIQMPRMDGNEFCKQVKQSADTRDIPVILLTARATSETVIQGLSSGADDYLSKPFNARELILRVSNLIQLFKQKRALQDMNEQLGEMVQEQIDVILEERESYERSLLGAKNKAEASERMKSTILDNMSHEFRTPITVILGYLDIILEEAPATLGPFVADIRQNSNRLLRTLDTLLKFSEFESSDLEENIKNIELFEHIEGEIARISPVAESKNIALSVVKPESPLWVTCAVEPLMYIVNHLVDNAVKFTKDGSVTVSFSVDEDVLSLSVRDTGIGIHADYLAKMFDAFSQESSGTTRSYQGTGLGLALVKRILDKVDGDISVSSVMGTGSTFTVSFPCESATWAESSRNVA